MDMSERTFTLIKAANENGWSVEETKTDDNGRRLECTRNNESMVLVWSATRYLGKESYHSMHGRQVRVKNAAAAMRFIIADPKVTEQHVREVKTRKIAVPEDEGYEIPKQLPFDLETAEDSDVLDAVRNKKIVWRNSAGDYDSAHVMPKHLKIDQGKKGRGITFCGERGYISIYVSRIMQVL